MTDAEALRWMSDFDEENQELFVRVEYLGGDWSAELIRAHVVPPSRIFKKYSPTSYWSGYQPSFAGAVTELRKRFRP